MKRLLNVFLLMGFVSFSIAQEKEVIEPSFLMPELTPFELMNSKMYTNPNHLKGKILRAARWHYNYDKEGNEIYRSEEKTTFHSRGIKKYVFKDSNYENDFSSDSYVDKGATPKIIKEITIYKGQKRITAKDKYNDNFVYLYKENKIIEKRTRDTFSTNYFYDEKNRLIKIISKNANGKVTKIEKATYKENVLVGKIIYNHEKEDEIIVDKIEYKYVKDVLVKFTKATTRYLPLIKKTAIDKLDYSNSNHVEVVEKLVTNKAIYQYDSKNQIVNAVFLLPEEIFIVTFRREKNKVIIETSLPEWKQYVYAFDAKGNPKEIVTYIIEEDAKRLSKKTVFQIDYQ